LAGKAKAAGFQVGRQTKCRRKKIQILLLLGTWCGKAKTTMLVPPDMMAAQTRMVYQMNRFCAERVQARMFRTATAIREICKIVQDILKEVELQEPRFISSLVECNGR